MSYIPANNRFTGMSSFMLKAWELCKPRMIQHIEVSSMSPYRVSVVSPKQGKIMYRKFFTKATPWGRVKINTFSNYVNIHITSNEGNLKFVYVVRELRHLELFLSHIHSIESLSLLDRFRVSLYCISRLEDAPW